MIVSALVVIVIGGGITVGVLQKVQKWKREAAEWTALGFEAQCIAAECESRPDTVEHHVLCLGNSITLHHPMSTIPGADPLWRGDWGMCASRPDNDYVHQLETMFQLTNPCSTVTGVNIAPFERNFSLSLDSLIGPLCQGKDIIVLKIGENVVNCEGYYEAFNYLVDYCLRYTPGVYIVGSYWKNLQKERAMVAVAREHHLPYIPLFWISELYSDKVQFAVGDTIYDTNGSPYPIVNDFFISHPNDQGMRMIADAIYRRIAR